MAELAMVLPPDLIYELATGVPNQRMGGTPWRTSNVTFAIGGIVWASLSIFLY